MITEKMIYIYRNLERVDIGTLRIPYDIPINELVKIVMSKGTLLWFVGGAYYLVPTPKLENIVSVFEDLEKVEGHVVSPLELRLELSDMQKIGPIIIPLV